MQTRSELVDLPSVSIPFWKGAPEPYVVALNRQFLTAWEVAALVKALLPYLTELDGLDIHEKLSKGCNNPKCPCCERGFGESIDVTVESRWG